MELKAFVLLSALVSLVYAQGGVKRCNPGEYMTSSGECEKCPPGMKQPFSGQDCCYPEEGAVLDPAHQQIECKAGTAAPITFNPCSMGTYIPDLNCGRGGSPCPETHSCVMEDADSYAVCCPRVTESCQDGYIRSGSNDCTPCPKNFFKAGPTTCSACSTGFMTEMEGTASESGCIALIVTTAKPNPCPPGHIMMGDTCAACPKGYYQKNMGSCTPCPKGQTTDTIGSGSEKDCHDFDISSCKRGEYKSGKMCKECPLGYYQPQGSTLCYKCRPGRTTQDTGSTSEDACIADLGSCPPGTFHNGDTCELCGQNMYQNEPGQLDCKTCPKGFYTANPGSGSLDDCKSSFGNIEFVHCGRGSYSLDGTAECEMCPQGTYQDKEGQTKCEGCPKGTTTGQPGSVMQFQCLKISTDGRIDCSAGQESVSGKCRKCSRDTYKTNWGREDCSKCPGALITLGEGSKFQSQCVENCPLGTFLNTILQCQACPKGKYQDERGQTSCKTCDKGRTTDQIASTSRAQCMKADEKTDCPAGQHFDKFINRCYDCREGSFKDWHGPGSCMLCPTDFTTPTGGSTSESQCNIPIR